MKWFGKQENGRVPKYEQGSKRVLSRELVEAVRVPVVERILRQASSMGADETIWNDFSDIIKSHEELRRQRDAQLGTTPEQQAALEGLARAVVTSGDPRPFDEEITQAVRALLATGWMPGAPATKTEDQTCELVSA